MKLLEITQGLGVRCHQYVCDTQLYFFYSRWDSECSEQVSGFGNGLLMGANTLKLNPVKTEMLFIGGAVSQGVGMQHVLDRVEFCH